MFVRKKTSRGGKTIYQLVETARIGGKVRQRVIAHLGESACLAEAIETCEANLERAKQNLAESLTKADAIRSNWQDSGEKGPDDLETIRRLARYNWNFKFLRNALISAQQSQERIPLLERRLASLRAAEKKCQEQM